MKRTRFIKKRNYDHDRADAKDSTHQHLQQRHPHSAMDRVHFAILSTGVRHLESFREAVGHSQLFEDTESLNGLQDGSGSDAGSLAIMRATRSTVDRSTGSVGSNPEQLNTSASAHSGEQNRSASCASNTVSTSTANWRMAEVCIPPADIILLLMIDLHTNNRWRHCVLALEVADDTYRSASKLNDHHTSNSETPMMLLSAQNECDTVTQK